MQTSAICASRLRLPSARRATGFSVCGRVSIIVSPVRRIGGAYGNPSPFRNLAVAMGIATLTPSGAIIRAGRRTGPKTPLLLHVQATGHRGRLRPDEAVLVAQRIPQGGTKIGMITPPDYAEHALLLLGRGAMEDRAEARNLRRRIGRQAAGAQFFVDAHHPVASNDARNVFIPIPQSGRRGTPALQYQRHECTTQAAKRATC